jgi:hypothetical protein
MKPAGAVRLAVVPATLPTANDHIAAWPRHHAPLETTHGGTIRDNKSLAWFSLAAVTPDGTIVAVAVCGRPANRNNDDGQTIEVMRLASDGTPNACSFLYGASARTAKAMGAARIITYILDSETGTSLRGAGWTLEHEGAVSCWNKGKPRTGGVGATIWREHMNETKARWVLHFREPINVERSAPLRARRTDDGQLGMFEGLGA